MNLNHFKLASAVALVLAVLFAAPQTPRLLARGFDRITQAGECNILILPNDGGTSANERAPNARFRFGRAVYLITATELAAAGYQNGSVPTLIGWTYDVGPGVAASAPLIIYLQNTADTTNTKSTTWTTAITGMTMVHNATTALPSAAGSFNITFSGGSPFTYTGGGLYIAFDWGQYTGTLSTTAMVSCNMLGLPNGLLGAQSSTAAPPTLTASSFRPETILRGMPPANDAAVDDNYSIGELPVGLTPPLIVGAVVSDRGGNTLNNVPVMLNVTGANSFSNSQSIASLASCTGQAGTTFAGFSPSSPGANTVTVSVPADGNNTNNSVSHPLNTTSVDYSYKYPGTTAGGGVGLSGATGAFVAKFNLLAANAVTAIKVEFPAITAGTYRLAIYADAGGVPSTTALYVDAADRTVSAAGAQTITLPSPVSVGPGPFYVGIQQTNTTNVGYSFDNESPIRSQTFFFASPLPVAAWVDFAPGTDFKLNVGIVLQNPGGGPVPSAVVSRKLHAGTPFDIPLPLAGTGVECRNTGGVLQIMFTFPAPVTFTGAAVTSGTGMVSSTSGSGTTTATVNLSGVTDQQRLTVTLQNATGIDTPAADVSIQFGVLVGDVNGNGAVNASDVSQTKSRINQPVDGTNFRSDVNVNGAINASDIALVKANIPHALP